MLLALDFGHTALKLTLAPKLGDIAESAVIVHGSPADVYMPYLKRTFDGIILSAPVNPPEELVNAFKGLTPCFITLGPDTPLPLQNKYGTPETLGYDRIGSAVGAWSLFPHQHSLVVDMGTCINYEYIDAHGFYLGGAISPGYEMRFKGMHTFTGNLPLMVGEPEMTEVLGTSTESCLRSGVVNGMIYEVNGFIDEFRNRHMGGKVLLTGGDSPFFAKFLKNNIFARPKLVAEGMLEILRYNMK